MMKILINGKPVEVPGNCTTLAQLLEHEGFGGVGQAVAVDSDVVPKLQWDSFQLHDGMKITVIRAVCGG